MKRFQFTLIFILLVSFVFAQKHQIYIQEGDQKFGEKNAILVIHGLEGNNKTRKIILKSFIDQGYDVYVPEYISRKTFKESLQNFEKFFYEYKLNEYKELNVVCMIMGGYVFNTFLNSHPELELKSIVFDRSPIQERAAKVVTDKIPLIVKISVGSVVKDIADVHFIPVKKNMAIALIIESKANLMMRIFKKPTLEMGVLDYDPDNMNQEYDDYMYVPFGHTEMYTEMPTMSDEILYFFRYGKFPDAVKRTPYKQYPFQRKLDPED